MQTGIKPQSRPDWADSRAQQGMWHCIALLGIRNRARGSARMNDDAVVARAFTLLATSMLPRSDAGRTVS